MFTNRRIFFGSMFLGVLLASVVNQQRGSDVRPSNVVGGASRSMNDANTVQLPAPPAAPVNARAPVTSEDAADVRAEDIENNVCVQTFDDLVAFVEKELNAGEPSEDQLDVFTAELENLPRRLAGSRDSNLLLTALLLDQPEDRVSDDPSASESLLVFGSRAAESDSPVLAWHALRVCVQAEDYCPFVYAEQALLEADRDNAEAWVLAATLRYRRGDVAGALAAMQRAARAPDSTWYWTETAATIERSLAEQTAVPFSIRAQASLNFQAIALPLDLSLQMCREQSAASSAWAEACLTFGRLRGENNETEMARGLASLLQQHTLTAIGDEERSATESDERALSQSRREAVGRKEMISGARLRGTLIFGDPGRYRAYLSAIQEDGEQEGYKRFLRQELPMLVQSAGLLERDGARECAAQLFAPSHSVETRSGTYRDYRIEEYPIRVGDRLRIYVPGWAIYSRSLQIAPEGLITMPRIAAIEAIGKTTGQLEGEIASLLSEYHESPEVHVFLISSPSPDELRLEFDNALRDSAE